jgi:hypothetical protein
MSQRHINHTYKGVLPALARNMSAPPRSMVSFRPYGAEVVEPYVMNGHGLGLRLRADPDSLIKAQRPSLNRRMGTLRRQALACGRAKNQPGAAAAIAELRVLRLNGLVGIAAGLAGEPAVGLEGLPQEALLDRLTDLSHRLPLTDLPAMGLVEPVTAQSPPWPRQACDPLATLWLLTHMNGRTFDRDGLPMPAAGLAEGRAYDLYTR